MALTAEAATQFETHSAENAAIVALAFPCGCQAYEDVFTFGRWIAQGFAPRKGTHGVRLSTWRVTEKRDEVTGETERRRFPTTSVVFCRCQVDASKPRNGTGGPAKAAAAPNTAATLGRPAYTAGPQPSLFDPPTAKEPQRAPEPPKAKEQPKPTTPTTSAAPVKGWHFID